VLSDTAFNDQWTMRDASLAAKDNIRPNDKSDVSTPPMLIMNVKPMICRLQYLLHLEIIMIVECVDL